METPRRILAAFVLLVGCSTESATLSGSVVDRVTGAPIAGARVMAPGGSIVAISDADGSYALDAPAGTTRVTVEADGYLAMTRDVRAGVVVALFPATTGEAADRALFGARRVFDELSGDVRPQARDLLRRIRELPDAPTLRELIPLPEGTIAAIPPPPATIRVWRRGIDGSTASCSGRVDVIPFETYVKGVLPHEWIPSWDPLALEMGAVAIRTYAWWWIAAGGKYDCADLDDTTASQVYEDEFLPKTDAAVDATAGVSIVRDDSIVFAEYSAENGDPTEYGVDEPHCAGESVFGHGRGTCQWGTQRWAVSEGRDYVWMSAHYYPGAQANIPGPPYAASFAAESYPSEMTSGDEAVVWLEYRNDGRMTWDLEGTRVGTTEPRDRPSPFYKEGNWISPSRPSGADHSDYGPGSVGRFSFVLVAPEVDAETTFVEHFGLVQEGVTWFGPEDDAVTWTITVKPRVQPIDPNDPDPNDPGAADDPGAPGILGGCSVARPGAAAPPTLGSSGRATRTDRRDPAGPLRNMSRLALLAILGVSVLRRGRLWALLALPLVVVALGALGGAGCATSADPHAPAPAAGSARVALGGDSALIATFEAAALESGVPAELLATVGFVQTRLRMQPAYVAGGHGSPQSGLMGLGVTAASSIDRAASLIDADPFDVSSDVDTNVRAAAAVLAAEQRASGVEPVTLADWSPALAAYGGEALARDVLWRLARGWRGRDDQGLWLVATARPVGARPDLDGDPIDQQSFAIGYPGAIWNPAYSGNYAAGSRGAAEINYVVIHTVQGSYSGCISWFQNASANVSAHYVVRSSDGEITQMVDDSDVAWHDGCFNSESIGIEHEGYVQDPATWYTEPMYVASAQLTAWLCDAYGIPKDRAHIMGHGETPDCSDHTDPGSGWDWDHYMDLVISGGTPVYEASAGASEHPSEMTEGDEAVVWFELTNEGNVTWGLDETRLGTQDPQDRPSPFFVDGNWLSENRATGADHSNYGPGSVGRFTFAIRAPEVDADTTFVETFQLVQEGVTWFGPKVSMTILVHARDDGPPVDPEDPGDPAVEPGAGDEGGPSGLLAGGCRIGAGGSTSAPFALFAACAILVVGAISRRRSR
jgi:hypothetical protein